MADEQKAEEIIRVVVTGANRGIGLEFVQQLSKRDNFCIVALCRTPEKADALKQLKEKYNDKISIEKYDSTNDGDVESVANTLKDKPIDILLLNAGIKGESDYSKMGNLSRADMLNVYNVNAVGPMLLGQALWENVKASKRKQIVGISTGVASIGDCGSNTAVPYRCSKAAFNMAFQSFKHESIKTKAGVHALLVSPGWVQTDMGGGNARLTSEQSVGLMLEVIDKYEKLKNGGFYSQTGKEWECFFKLVTYGFAIMASAIDMKTPLSQFVIDEEKSAFDTEAPPPPPKERFRERPRHGSQTDFSEVFKQRDEDQKDSHFDSQINHILKSFAKQYLREYIKMKIKTSVYDTIDKELNRKSFTSNPQYYHLRKKKPAKSPRHPAASENASPAVKQTEGFQPVYSLRIASSRTEIGADKNEYTAYIIVGSRISPFDSKLTVCVKRFVELRTFASEIARRLPLIDGKELELQSDFPFHSRLFGTIDSKKLEERRNSINLYLQSVCADENAVRHSYFLSFFDFNDGQYNYIDDDQKYELIDKYHEEEFRLKCIEETLEIIGMNGGIPPDSDEEDEDDDDDDDDGNAHQDHNHQQYPKSTPLKKQHLSSESNEHSVNTPIDTPIPDDMDEDAYFNLDVLQQADDDDDMELNFEVPYDLHHYKNPEYKLVAAIFDIIQQQLEMEQESEEHHRPHLERTDSRFMDSYNKHNYEIDNLYHQSAVHGSTTARTSRVSFKDNNANSGHAGGRPPPKHARKHSGGAIAPAPVKHKHTTSIIESAFSPATPMEFHPSISAQTGKIQGNITSNNFHMTGAWTANLFRDKFHSSIRNNDGGARIIRTASEATSDRSLSYKIPTMVSDIWNRLQKLLDKKLASIPTLLQAVRKDLYPIIQEAMTDVAPIIKVLYNNAAANVAQFAGGVGSASIDTSADESGVDLDEKGKINGTTSPNFNKLNPDDVGSTKSMNSTPQQQTQNHGKYLSMYGYDGDEEIDTDSSDSDGSEIRRSVGIRHFPLVKAMRQYCLSEPRLYEFFLAFENLAIDQIFGDINIIFGDSSNKEKQKKKDNSNITISLNSSNKQKLKNGTSNAGSKPKHRQYQSSIDLGDYVPSISSVGADRLPNYQHIHLLRYNYSILENTSSRDFTERIRHIERIHNQINLILCEIVYAVLKCFMKCLGDIILYKDQLEEKYASCSNTFDQDVISQHEDALLTILRESGYNISFIVDDLKQKIKSEFKDYSSVIFNPLLDGISTIGEISLNCICLMISQFVFDEGEFPTTIEQFRRAFIQIWFEPIDYYIADFTECVFYILYQSAIGLVHSASQDLLTHNIYASHAAASHSTSLWYQILRGQKFKNVKKFIPKHLRKNVSVKDILDLVIERTLTNIVDETLIYIKIECEKNFFKKFEKKEQRLFANHDF